MPIRRRRLMLRLRLFIFIDAMMHCLITLRRLAVFSLCRLCYAIAAMPPAIAFR